MARVEVVHEERGRVRLRLRGRLAEEAELHDLKRSLEEHYVDDGVSDIRMDVSALEQISLEGIGTFLELHRECQRRGKRFAVEGATGQVRDKLAITGTLEPLKPD